MKFRDAQIIELQEYIPKDLPDSVLYRDAAKELWRSYSNIITIESPFFNNNWQWRLTSQGWVGQIPLIEDLVMILHPRVELGNLFRMWEYAYRLKSFHFLHGIIGCDSLEEFYQQLMSVLAKKILDRARKGFYRSYIQDDDRLPYLRGRMDTRKRLQRPWEVDLHCHFEEHTGDIEDNQILAWTILKIARYGLCDEKILAQVRSAYHALSGFTTLTPFNAKHCMGRLYHRLNSDYHPLHALCSFFLESSGPTHKTGDKEMLPFLMNMPRLFEMFVAEWLKSHLSRDWSVKPQEHLQIDDRGQFEWIADLVLYDSRSDVPHYVLDTKYKTGPKPSMDDIAKVVAYAESVQCKEAILVYPSPIEVPLDQMIGHIRVRSLSFLLGGDLEENGKTFLNQIFD